MSASVLAVIVSVIAVAVSLAAAVVAIRARRQLHSVRSNFAVLWGSREASDVATVLRGQHDRLGGLERRLGAFDARITKVSEHVAAGLRHVSVVRYDAFGDMGGRLSFSAAVLDDAGDGLVLSSIHARGESRTYAKAIAGGTSQVTLTPEEQQALATAMSDRKDA